MTRVHLVFIFMGLALIAVAAAYWVATGVQSVLFVMAGIVLIALGAIQSMSDAVADQGSNPGEPPQ